MFGLLAQKRKIAHLIKEKKGKTIDVAQETGRGRAIGQKAREKTQLYNVSVNYLLSLHGLKARSLRRP